MMKTVTYRIFSFLLISISITAAAQQNTLVVGSPAPELKVAEWIKGEPVTLERGKVNVVEFTIVGCGPCIKAIPHLSAMYDKYAGKINLVSVFADGRNPKPVSRVVQNYSEDVHYPVAVDVPDEYMKDNWMTASGNSGYPTVFVIDKEGRIAWIGNPHSGHFDSVVALLDAGKFDPQAQIKQEKAVKEKFDALIQKYLEPASNGEEKELNVASNFLDSLATIDARYLNRKFSLLLKHHEQDAYKVARQSLNENVADEYLLSEYLQAVPSLKNPDWIVMRDIASRMYETENKIQAGAGILRHIMESYYMEGQYDSAIIAQKKVLEHVMRYNMDMPEWIRSDLLTLQWLERMQKAAAKSASSIFYSDIDNDANSFSASLLNSIGLPSVTQYNNRSYGRKGYRTLKSVPLEWLYKLAYIDIGVPYTEDIKMVYVVEEYDKIEELFSFGKNFYNYRLVVPSRVSLPEILKIMQKDLKTSFGYSAEFVNQEITVWKLRISESAREKFMSSSFKDKYIESLSDTNFVMHNSFIGSSFIQALKKYNPAEFYHYPIIDETNLNRPINLEIKLPRINGSADISALKEELKKQGFELVKSKMKMKALIITDR